MHKLLFLVFFFFWPHSVARVILDPDQGLNLRPLNWKRGALTSGPPGESRVASPKAVFSSTVENFAVNG